MLLAMDSASPTGSPSFWARLRLAFRLIFDPALAGQIERDLKPGAAAKPVPAKVPERPVEPARVHASGLFMLSALQREGRLIDFLQQDIASYSDEDVGAAARVVHTGCGKILKQYLALEPAVALDEGARMTVPPGFDAQRIRLTGNVAGHPPFKVTVKHHGWVAREVRFPALAENLDARVIAPAEVELD
jgi:hypothetical protein